MSIGTSLEIEKLINRESITIEELETVLKKISVKAREERTREKRKYIIGWILLIITLYSYSLSYFLSIPMSIITFLYVLVVIDDSPTIKSLFLIETKYSSYILKEFIKGYKKTNMKTPIWSYSYFEAQIEVKIEELSRMNLKKNKMV